MKSGSAELVVEITCTERRGKELVSALVDENDWPPSILTCVQPDTVGEISPPPTRQCNPEHAMAVSIPLGSQASRQVHVTA